MNAESSLYLQQQWLPSLCSILLDDDSFSAELICQFDKTLSEMNAELLDKTSYSSKKSQPIVRTALQESTLAFNTTEKSYGGNGSTSYQTHSTDSVQRQLSTSQLRSTFREFKPTKLSQSSKKHMQNTTLLRFPSITTTLSPSHQLSLQEQQRHLFLNQYAKLVRPQIITQYPPPPLKYAHISSVHYNDIMSPDSVDTAKTTTSNLGTKGQPPSLKQQHHHHRISLPFFKIIECTNDISPASYQHHRDCRSCKCDIHHHRTSTHKSTTWTRKMPGFSCWMTCYPSNTAAKMTTKIGRQKGKHQVPRQKDAATQTTLTATLNFRLAENGI